MKKLTPKKVHKLLPVKKTSNNKTDGGHALIIGGNKKYIGASILAALAATRMGAGYTHLMNDTKKFPWLQFPDFILHPLKVAELKEMTNFSIGIGPGLEDSITNKKLLNYLIKNKFEKVIVDAGALSILAKMNNKKLPSTWILTPHHGELARLLNVKAALIKNDPVKYALMAQKKYHCAILLKGHKTLLISTNKEIFFSTEGQSALAKAGSGDVLTGILTALRAQGLNSLESMQLGCFIHGHTSKIYLKEGGDQLSLRPLDIIKLIPKSLKNLRKTKYAHKDIL